MKQQLGKGKLETLVAQRLIDGEYPVELPFLLCFIKTKKKVTRFLNTMAYRLVQLFYHLQFDSDSLYYYNFFYMRRRLIAVWSVIISGLI